MRWLLCLLLLGAGCGKRNPGDLLAPAEVGTIVVDARLIVGRPMPEIGLRFTQSPAEPFKPDGMGLIDAEVEVTTSNGDTIRYVDLVFSQGVYVSEARYNGDPEPIVTTPDNAMNTFFASGLDTLVLGNFIVRKDGDS